MPRALWGPDMSEWFLAHEGKSLGPYSLELLRGYLGEGRIGGDAMVWRSGMAEWALSLIHI